MKINHVADDKRYTQAALPRPYIKRPLPHSGLPAWVHKAFPMEVTVLSGGWTCNAFYPTHIPAFAKELFMSVGKGFMNVSWTEVYDTFSIFHNYTEDSFTLRLLALDGVEMVITSQPGTKRRVELRHGDYGCTYTDGVLAKIHFKVEIDVASAGVYFNVTERTASISWGLFSRRSCTSQHAAARLSKHADDSFAKMVLAGELASQIEALSTALDNGEISLIEPHISALYNALLAPYAPRSVARPL